MFSIRGNMHQFIIGSEFDRLKTMLNKWSRGKEGGGQKSA